MDQEIAKVVRFAVCGLSNSNSSFYANVAAKK